MARKPRGGARKTIYDPVHGMIALDGAALELIGTPAFQRLWGIRQTGFAHLVFPGANHTRLEHSLGVFSVAQRLASGLGLEPGATAELTAGGLLHDIGHGPFSHTFDDTMIEVLGTGHERVSRDWVLGRRTSSFDAGRSLPEILERHGISPNSVADLVDPPGSHRPGLSRLLHGAVDADRIDYLQRDAHYTGVAHGVIDAHRILETVRWRAGRVCFAEKGRSAIEGFLVGRALMYSSVYYHKTVRAAEVMAQSAVERLPGYPEGCRPLMELNDGQLLDHLRDASDRSRSLVEGLLTRQLFKRVGGWREAEPGKLRALRALERNPPERRRTEDELAARLKLPPGELLLDVSGAQIDTEAAQEWEDVAVLEDGALTHPFRGPGPWQTLLRRAPSIWIASAYVAPRHRALPRSRVDRALDAAIG